MKQLRQFIQEKLQISKDDKIKPKYIVKDRNELFRIMKKRIMKDPNSSFNDLDIKNITDLSWLCRSLPLKTANIDISEWNVSQVTDMHYSFCGLENFNCDLSKWDISNVKDFENCFKECTNFEGKDLDKWKFNKNVECVTKMFMGCENLNFDASKWKFPKDCDTYYMFLDCNKMKKYPSWYPENEKYS